MRYLTNMKQTTIDKQEKQVWRSGKAYPVAPDYKTPIEKALSVDSRTVAGQLKRDGKVVMEGTEGEAMSYIHRNHCFSYSHALAHEGFSYDTAEEVHIRKVLKA